MGRQAAAVGRGTGARFFARATARLVTRALLALALAPGEARADQLQCLRMDVAIAARKLLPPGAVMIDFCSQCDDHVKVVRVTSAEIVHDCDEEVQVTGVVLFEKTIGGTYEPRETPYQQRIDLAYAYVEAGPNRFNWLGGVLGLKAQVRVKSLTLPTNVHAALPPRAPVQVGRPVVGTRAAWQPSIEPPGQGPGIVFREERVRFVARPASTRLERLERNASTVAAGPGGQRVVWGLSAKQALLVGKGHPRPLAVGSGNLLGVTFSPAGGYLAVRAALAPLTVVSTSDARVVYARPVGRECEARFQDETTVVFHDDAPEGRLWSWDETRGLVARGPARVFAGCAASQDGKTWLVWDSGGNIDRLDERTGGSELLVRGADGPAFLSPDGARVCYLLGKELRCTRLADHAVEVLARVASEALGFDDTGKRFLFVGDATEHDEAYAHVFHVADFATETSLALESTRLLGGGSAALSSGGQLLLLGSGRGVWLLDLDGRKKRLHAGASLYSVANAPGVPRGGFVTRERPDGRVEDLFLLHE